MNRVKVESNWDILYLVLVANALGLMLGGIIKENTGIILAGIPELLVALIGLRYWPRYTKQRWEYLRAILMASVVSLPLGITLAMLSNIPSQEKIFLIGIFTVMQILAIAIVLDARAKFNDGREERNL